MDDVQLVELSVDVEGDGASSMDGINVREIVRRAMLVGTTTLEGGANGEENVGGRACGDGSMVELMNDDEADEARRYFGVF